MSKPAGEVRLVIGNGDERPIHGTLTIGRSSKNDIVLDQDEVSRNHALVQRQGPAEFWLVDLGSSNGTLLNQRVVVQPVRLANGDRIRIGGTELTFLCDEAAEEEDFQDTLSGPTLVNLRVTRQWLLLADIEGFTPLSQRLQPAELAGVVGRWVASCRSLVDASGGSIHKYLGDGWLANWDAAAADPLADCLIRLLERQKRSDPPFRFVAHLGDVTSSGSAAGGELGMLGPDVNLLFRMEKLAGQLKSKAMVTASCWPALKGRLKGRSLGSHKVAGFDRSFECFEISAPDA